MRDAYPEGGIDEALRVVGRLVALGAFTLVIVFALGMLLKPVLPTGLPSGRDGRVLLLIIFAIGLALAHVAVIVGFERSQWAVAGIGRASWRPLGVVGALVLGAGASSLAGLALIVTNAGSLAPRAAGSLGEYAWSALGEIAILTLVQALAWHGYAFGLIEERWGRVTASMATAFGFALAGLWSHAMPGWTIVTIVALGVFLGAIRARTGNVVAAWLAHLSFLWAGLAVFHSSDPRFAHAAPPQYALELGPGPFSGGAWGLSGSLASGLLLLGLALLALRRNRAPLARR